MNIPYLTSQTKLPPTYLFLQWFEPEPDEGVTWCEDQIHEEDVPYVLLSKLEEAERKLENLQEPLEALREILQTLMAQYKSGQYVLLGGGLDIIKEIEDGLNA